MEYSHYIRRSRHDTISGVPDVLFLMPEISSHVNQKQDVSETELDAILCGESVIPDALDILNGEYKELIEFFNYVVLSEGLKHPPKTWEEAGETFEKIIKFCV